MEFFNIVFDGDFDDVDIIAVPNEIALKMEQIGQEFLYWLPSAKEEDYWTIINGKTCLVAETTGFVKWLNVFYCKSLEKAYVEKKHTKYNPLYRIIDF